MNKPNPRKRPATHADVERAKKAAFNEAVDYAMAIFFTVLCDKESADKDIMQRVWGEVNDLADSVAKGYVSVADLRRVLNVEYDIII